MYTLKKRPSCTVSLLVPLSRFSEATLWVWGSPLKDTGQLTA